MARSFDPKQHKIETTSLNQLRRYSTQNLEKQLKEWSRIANARYKRIAEYDPMFSVVQEAKRGGKFGASGHYTSRESMLNELKRIKNQATHLKKREATKEKEDLSNILKGIEVEGKKVSEDTVRIAFIVFLKRNNALDQEVYDYIKKLILRMSADYNYIRLSFIIERLSTQYEKNEYEIFSNDFEPDKW